MKEQNQKLLILAHNYVSLSTDYLNNKIEENEYRKLINKFALIERAIPYEHTVRRYIVGDCCFNTLLNNIIRNEENILIFKVNTILPNRGLLTNRYIQDFIYDLVSKKSKLCIRKTGKIHIRMEQYIAPCKNGKLNKDADNNEKKGVIDGIAAGLGIDDTGDRISYSSAIKPLPEGEDPYTLIYIIPDEEVDKFFNNYII